MQEKYELKIIFDTEKNEMEVHCDYSLELIRSIILIYILNDEILYNEVIEIYKNENLLNN